MRPKRPKQFAALHRACDRRNQHVQEQCTGTVYRFRDFDAYEAQYFVVAVVTQARPGKLRFQVLAALSLQEALFKRPLEAKSTLGGCGPHQQNYQANSIG